MCIYYPSRASPPLYLSTSTLLSFVSFVSFLRFGFASRFVPLPALLLMRILLRSSIAFPLPTLKNRGEQRVIADVAALGQALGSPPVVHRGRDASSREYASSRNVFLSL